MKLIFFLWISKYDFTVYFQHTFGQNIPPDK